MFCYVHRFFLRTQRNSSSRNVDCTPHKGTAAMLRTYLGQSSLTTVVISAIAFKLHKRKYCQLLGSLLLWANLVIGILIDQEIPVKYPSILTIGFYDCFEHLRVIYLLITFILLGEHFQSLRLPIKNYWGVPVFVLLTGPAVEEHRLIHSMRSARLYFSF